MSRAVPTHPDLLNRVTLELVAVVARPHLGLLASKLGGNASTYLGAIHSDVLRRARQYAAFAVGSGTGEWARAFAQLRHLADVPAILVMRLLQAREVHQTLSDPGVFTE